MSILSNHLNRNCSIKEAIVYQMGKVGSTSVVASINSAGIPAYQSHFLDTPSFHEIVDMFDRRTSVGKEASHHVSIQLQENLLLRNKLTRYQNNEMAKDERLGIITLVRDPLAWYFSNLSQNFFQVEANLRNWLVAENKLSDGAPLTEQHLQYFFTELFTCFDSIIPDMDQNHAALIQNHFNEAGKTPDGGIYRFIYSQVAVLHRIHFWFDKHFASLLNTDVLRYKFDKSRGYSVFHRGNIDIMLMKFEQLNQLHDELAQFLGLKSFHIKRLNESKDKTLGQLISSTRKNLIIPDCFKEKYFSSEYYETFYAQDADVRKSLSFPRLKKRRTENIEIKLKHSPIDDVSNFHNQKKVALDSFLSFGKDGGLPEWPIEISIEVSNQCDLASATYPSYSPLNKQNYQHLSADNHGFIDLDSLHSIGDLLQHAIMVHLRGGGEPTSHPDFSQLISFLSRYEVLIEFSTHGLSLTETLCDHLVKNAVHEVNIDLSGADKEDYEKTSTGGDYNRVLRNIELLAESKKKYGSAYPIISINSIAFELHLEKFPSFVELMAELDADAIMMGPEKHSAIMGKARKVAQRCKIDLIAAPFTNTTCLPGAPPEEKTQFKHRELNGLSTEALTPGRERDSADGEAIPPDVGAPAGKTEIFLANGNIPCFEPFKSFHVACNGRVYPCAFTDTGAYLGTLDSVQTGKALWDNKEFSQLREHALIQELPKAGCFDCMTSSLYPKQHNLEQKVRQYSAWFYRVFNAPFHPPLQKRAAAVGSNIEILEHKNKIKIKKTLYLHIGSPKTGTTSIQKYFSDNYKYYLDTQGLLYPRSGRHSTSHHPLAADLRAEFNQDKIPDHCYGGLSRGNNWEKLSSELKTLHGSYNKVVISSEDFFTLYKNSSLEPIKKIKNLLSDFNVIIVVYLRRQDKYIESLYNQEIKATLQSRENAGNLIHNHPTTRNNYYELMSAWADVFGEKNIIVRPFDPQLLINSNSVSDFMHVIGINERKQISSDIHTNKKLSRQEIIFKRELNRLYNDKLRCNKVFDTITSNLKISGDTKSTLLTKSIYKEIKNISEPLNQSLSVKFYNGKRLFTDFADIDSVVFIDEKQIDMEHFFSETLKIMNSYELEDEDKIKVKKCIDHLHPVGKIMP